jgi:hypothetical protein
MVKRAGGLKLEGAEFDDVGRQDHAKAPYSLGDPLALVQLA